MEVSEKLPIFAPSEHPFWLSGQNPEKAGLYDTALGARHHDPYSTFKPSRKGWFYFSYNFLKVRKKLGLVAILRLTDICLCPLKTRTSIAFEFTSKYLCIAKASERVLYSIVRLSKMRLHCPIDSNKLSTTDDFPKTVLRS